jgi:hypothetical protein
MAVNLSFLKKLIKEDFASKDQDLISKVAAILNPAVDQIGTLMNHGLGISDLKTQVKDLTLEVDGDGTPTTDISFQSTLTSKCSMMQIGRALNLTDSTIYPEAGFSISFTEKDGQIFIKNVRGLQDGYKWQVRVIAYV